VLVDQINANSPAERSGLQAGDQITAINGTPIFASSQIQRTVQAGQEVTLTVDRKGEKLDLRAKPEKQGDTFRLGLGYHRAYQPVLIKTDSLATALRYGWDFNVRIMRLTGVIMKQMFAGRRSARDVVGGPVRILQETRRTYNELGWAG